MKEFIGIITSDSVDMEDETVRNVVEKIERSLERDLDALYGCECYKETEDGNSKYIVFDRKEQDTTIISEEIFNLLHDTLIEEETSEYSSEFLAHPCNQFEMPDSNMSILGRIKSIFKKDKTDEFTEMEEPCLS